jgi:hypothetical protein
MAVFIAEGEIVEGKKCRIKTRRFDSKRLSKDPITNKPMIACQLDWNCEVEVLEAVQLEDEDKAIRESLNVHGEVGDMIQAKSIIVYVEGIRPSILSFEDKEGQSSRHGANLACTNKRTVGKIKYVLENLKKALAQSQNSNNNLLTTES